MTSPCRKLACDVPLICDPPPRRLLVFRSPHNLTVEQALWDEACASGKIVIIEPGWEIPEIPRGEARWVRRRVLRGIECYPSSPAVVPQSHIEPGERHGNGSIGAEAPRPTDRAIRNSFARMPGTCPDLDQEPPHPDEAAYRAMIMRAAERPIATQRSLVDKTSG